MNKGEFIEAIVDKTNLSKKDVGIVVSAFQDVVIETLKSDDSISLTGFGKFEAVKRAARSGRNPHTGESISIQSKVVPKFKPGKSFKDALN